jgi:hypothetical protein
MPAARLPEGMHHMFIALSMFIKHSTPIGVVPFFPLSYFYKHSNPPDLSLNLSSGFKN